MPATKVTPSTRQNTRLIRALVIAWLILFLWITMFNSRAQEPAPMPAFERAPIGQLHEQILQQQEQLRQSMREQAEAMRMQAQQMDSLIGTMLSVLEPALIIVMGVIVLAIVMAILLPIFQINQLVG